MGEATDRLTDRLDQIRLGMVRFDERVGLSGADPSRLTGAVQYLNMGEDQFGSLTADQLGVAASSVANLAFHLQNEYARETATAKRLQNAVKRVAADRVANAPGYQYEERLLRVIRDDPSLLDLDLLSQDAQHKADRLAFLAKQAEFAARIMMDLSLARRRDNARPRNME